MLLLKYYWSTIGILPIGREATDDTPVCAVGRTPPGKTTEAQMVTGAVSLVRE
jgi:hypothetical protein